MSGQMQFFLPMVKADAEKRLIYARAVQEIPDRSGEILDYATSKPNIMEWSESQFRDSRGLSKGNVRVMHTKVGAGIVSDITFNDDQKAVDVCIKVVDDQEWRKVESGVYTGVSIGGSYANKWKDGGLTRYTAKPTEISLVDRPCIPTATFFDLQKADGTLEKVMFQAALPPSFGAMWKARPKSFAELMAARPAPVEAPKTFGEMAKAFDESKHPRAKGKFASKFSPGRNEKEESRSYAKIGGATGILVGGILGRAAGSGAARAVNVGQNVKRKTQSLMGRSQSPGDFMTQLRHVESQGARIGRWGRAGRKFGRWPTAVALALAGSAYGAHIGRKEDEKVAANRANFSRIAATSAARYRANREATMSRLSAAANQEAKS